jgi:hypothetical protein
MSQQGCSTTMDTGISDVQTLREYRIRWEKKDKSFSDLHAQIN